MKRLKILLLFYTNFFFEITTAVSRFQLILLPLHWPVFILCSTLQPPTVLQDFGPVLVNHFWAGNLELIGKEEEGGGGVSYIKNQEGAKLIFFLFRWDT